MKELFIPYHLAILAKQKGFNEECFGWFDYFDQEEECKLEFENSKNSNLSNDKNCSAPVYQQITDWFRDKHNLEIECGKMWRYSSNYNPQETFYRATVNNFTLDRIERGGNITLYSTNEAFNIYNEALEKAIDEAFKLI